MKRFIAHMKGLSFTNRMALYLIIILAVGLLGGFILAMRSIEYQYTGPLTCWTVVFTPIGTACSIVLAFIVNKSKAENTSATGDGIKYALAMREVGAMAGVKTPEVQGNEVTLYAARPEI